MRVQAQRQFLGVATNNEAEYRALIEGLKTAKKWNPDRLEVYLDSKLVVEQVTGKYKTKKPELQELHAEVRQLLRQFPDVQFKHVVREENRGADALANMAIDANVPKKKFGG